MLAWKFKVGSETSGCSKIKFTFKIYLHQRSDSNKLEKKVDFSTKNNILKLKFYK